MTEPNKKKLILSLIKDNLINTKLVSGLNALGMDASLYSLHLSETIFELMGFEDNKWSDLVFEHYLSMVEKVNEINFSQSHEELDVLASEIYKELMIRK